jgi:hypothetical protein
MSTLRAVRLSPHFPPRKVVRVVSALMWGMANWRASLSRGVRHGVSAPSAGLVAVLP